MKKTTRIIAFVLSAILAIPATVIPSHAEDTVQYSESDLHELMSYTNALSAGHVKRLNDEEQMNTLVFANKDKTKTMYYYADDIKYVDDDGIIHDKTNKLTYSDGEYITRDNNIMTVIPADLSNGVSVSRDDIKIKMTPNFTKTGGSSDLSIKAAFSEAPRGEADKVTYESVFGTGTSVRYTPTYSGVSEEIIIPASAGEYSFDFTVETSGLLLLYGVPGAEEANMKDVAYWYFAYPDDIDTPVAKLSNISICDSLGNTSAVKITCEKIADSEYTVSFVADSSALSPSDTVYTMSAYISFDPDVSYIEDTMISARYPSTNYGTSTTLKLGGSTSSYIVMRFPKLATNNTYDLLTESTIRYATLELYCNASNTTKTISIHHYRSNASWNETSLTYNNGGASYYHPNGNEPIDPTFYIRNTSGLICPSLDTIFWGLKRGISSLSQGIIFMLPDSVYNGSSSQNEYCSFYSTEHTVESQRPHLRIVYSDDTIPSNGYYLIKNIDGKYLAVNGGKGGGGRALTAANKSTFKTNDTPVILIDYYWRVEINELNYKFYSMLDAYGRGGYMANSCEVESPGSQWRVENAGNGYYYIRYGSQYLTVSGSSITLSSKVSNNSQKWAFEKQETFTKTVYVKDKKEVPIPNATIKINGTNMPGRRRDYYKKTNSKGRVDLVLIKGYKYGINVSHDSYTTGIHNKYFIDGNEELTINLYPRLNLPDVPIKPIVSLQRSSAYGWRCYISVYKNVSSGTAHFGIHNGADYRNGVSDSKNVKSILKGNVQKSEYDESRGNYIIIRYTYGSNKYITITYCHLASRATKEEGDNVSAGDIIGVMGNTGDSTGVHLHINIVDQDGIKYDPNILLGIEK